MKQGDEIICPHCKKDSFLTKETLMDGWTFKGEVLVCSLCKKTIETVNKDSKKKTPEIVNDEKLDKFAAFLDTEQVVHTQIETGEKTFCKDCKHYIHHPFLNRCALHTTEVNPMDDCPDFKKKN